MPETEENYIENSEESKDIMDDTIAIVSMIDNGNYPEEKKNKIKADYEKVKQKYVLMRSELSEESTKITKNELDALKKDVSSVRETIIKMSKNLECYVNMANRLNKKAEKDGKGDKLKDAYANMSKHYERITNNCTVDTKTKYIQEVKKYNEINDDFHIYLEEYKKINPSEVVDINSEGNDYKKWDFETETKDENGINVSSINKELYSEFCSYIYTPSKSMSEYSNLQISRILSLLQLFTTANDTSIIGKSAQMRLKKDFLISEEQIQSVSTEFKEKLGKDQKGLFVLLNNYNSIDTSDSTRAGENINTFKDEKTGEEKVVLLDKSIHDLMKIYFSKNDFKVFKKEIIEKFLVTFNKPKLYKGLCTIAEKNNIKKTGEEISAITEKLYKNLNDLGGNTEFSIIDNIYTAVGISLKELGVNNIALEDKRNFIINILDDANSNIHYFGGSKRGEGDSHKLSYLVREVGGLGRMKYGHKVELIETVIMAKDLGISDGKVIKDNVENITKQLTLKEKLVEKITKKINSQLVEKLKQKFGEGFDLETYLNDKSKINELEKYLKEIGKNENIAELVSIIQLIEEYKSLDKEINIIKVATIHGIKDISNLQSLDNSSLERILEDSRKNNEKGLTTPLNIKKYLSENIQKNESKNIVQEIKNINAEINRTSGINITLDTLKNGSFEIKLNNQIYKYSSEEELTNFIEMVKFINETGFGFLLQLPMNTFERIINKRKTKNDGFKMSDGFNKTEKMDFLNLFGGMFYKTEYQNGKFVDAKDAIDFMNKKNLSSESNITYIAKKRNIIKSNGEIDHIELAKNLAV